MTFIKYPRTLHIKGSNFQKGDYDLKAVNISDLHDKNLIVEEKMDGANAGISFENDKLMLQSRGHYLIGGFRERHFALLKQWASTIEFGLREILSNKYIMFGEFLYAKHTMFYDELPHYFMEFDLYDKEKQIFLSTDARNELYSKSSLKDYLVSVLVIGSGFFEKESDFKSLITHSNFISEDRNNNLIKAAEEAEVDSKFVFDHTDSSTDMEGLYVKWEEDGIVKGRYKFVRKSFTNKILDQEQHWQERPIIKNMLSKHGKELMFLE